MSTPRVDRRHLDEAFAPFRDALTEILRQEADEAVNRAIARLQQEEGYVTVRTATVDVQITSLELAVPTPGTATKPGSSQVPKPAGRSTKKRAAKRAARRSGGGTTGRRGRPEGPVRVALLEVFAQAGDQALTAPELRTKLEAGGVEATADNLHQQLRRLVQGGVLERAGRGLYRAVAPDPSS